MLKSLLNSQTEPQVHVSIEPDGILWLKIQRSRLIRQDVSVGFCAGRTYRQWIVDQRDSLSEVAVKR